MSRAARIGGIRMGGDGAAGEEMAQNPFVGGEGFAEREGAVTGSAGEFDLTAGFDGDETACRQW